jgi:hypothetical protein
VAALDELRGEQELPMLWRPVVLDAMENQEAPRHAQNGKGSIDPMAMSERRPAACT